MNTTAKINSFLTPGQVHEQFQISRTTLWRLTKNGKIPSYRIGSSVRYSFEEVLEALKVKN